MIAAPPTATGMAMAILVFVLMPPSSWLLELAEALAEAPLVVLSAGDTLDEVGEGARDAVLCHD